MMKNNVVYKQNTASCEEVIEHLKLCDYLFYPRLSSRVDLEKFAKKIYIHAVMIEAWDGDRLLGFMSGYFNDLEKKIGYVNHLTVVEDYQGCGIAKELLSRTIEYGKVHGFQWIHLEIYKENGATLHIHEKLGFVRGDEKEGFIQMNLYLGVESK